MQFSFLKCIETHEVTYLYTTSKKKAKYSTKSATRLFVSLVCKPKHGSRGPNASRFSSLSDTQLVQGRRGRLTECAHAARFPENAVGSEKIAKYAPIFSG